MVDITLLGTAAQIPLPDRALASAIIECCGHQILFDCGEGTQVQMRKYKISPVKIDIIALSHYHGDHVFGLPGLLHTISNLGRTNPIYIIGPQGINEHLSPIIKLAGTLNYSLSLIDAQNCTFNLNQLISDFRMDATLKTFETNHRVKSIGFCFELNRAGKFNVQTAQMLNIPKSLWNELQNGNSILVDGKTIESSDIMGKARKGIKIAYTGDTSPCELMTKTVFGADLLISEATYGENAQADIALEHGHMTFNQAAALAKNANVSQLWLTHYSQMIENPKQC